MALAWVKLLRQNHRPVFKIDTGSNRYFDLYITTRPELLKPGLAAERTSDNFYSTRAVNGRPLASKGGSMLFPLPNIVQERFPNSNIYYMVKTFRDEEGNGPSISPVMENSSPQIAMDPIDPTEEPMRPTKDYEESLAKLNGTATRRRKHKAKNSGGLSVRRHNRGLSAAPAQAVAVPAVPGGTPKKVDPNVAAGLALVVQRIHQAVLEDPQIPQKPTYDQVARIFAHVLAHIPSESSASPATSSQKKPVSAASLLNAELHEQSHPFGGERELVAALSHGQQQLRYSQRHSREAALPFLIPLLTKLGPVLLQALPALMPMLQKLLGGLVGSKSAGYVQAYTDSTRSLSGADGAAAIQQLLAQVGGQAAAGGGGTAGGGAAGGAMAAVSPDQITGLLGALQGVGGMAGGMMDMIQPGAGMLKSIVDRLPIEKMFDGKAWIPDIDSDPLIQQLPWNSMVTLSIPEASLGVLAVPGRDRLMPLRNAELAIENYTSLEIADGQQSWVFRADQPIRLKLRVKSGTEELQHPYIDVRLSTNGKASTGIYRGVVRMRPLDAKEERITGIEIPTEILHRIPVPADPVCLSIRLVDRREKQFYALERRACFYLVQPHTVVIDSEQMIQDAPQLEKVPGLALTIPKTQLMPDGQQINWQISVVPQDKLSANAQFRPVTQQAKRGDSVLSGGVDISSVGLVDLLKYHPTQTISAESLAKLSDAINLDTVLRQRLSLSLREYIDAQIIARGRDGVRVRTQMGWLPVYLVSFVDGNAAGNPVRRDVQSVMLPVPLGISVETA